jgi:predicted esterase
MSQGDAPAPYVVEPTQPHAYTFILLHGLGSNGHKFGSELLDTGLTSDGRRLPELLPGARFVFPTARRRRSSAFGRAVLTQWFDITRLDDPSHQQERQLQGLAESAQDLLSVLITELSHVPAHKIVLGGISQGCAMSMAVLLALDRPLAAFVGLCGFLTFQRDLELVVEATPDDDDDGNPFACDVPEDQPPAPVNAQTFERDLLELDPLPNPTKDSTSFSTPVFLGHGSEDDKIPLGLGMSMAKVLRAAEYQVEWKCYQGLGHWYKIPDEIDDIIHFLRANADVHIVYQDPRT